jgi:7,8-dihydropterin-6-yl-methyl-4-(beta-D-ribofuranosyl)aminobenzene 5'-phosphate synthase
MLRAIRLINEAKTARAGPSTLTVDLHPARPDYRGLMAAQPISLEADPTFDEIEAAGATVSKNAEPHTILDDMFLVSGMIPRVTPYEIGIVKGIRFNSSTGSWEKDELIADERLLMCNLKGKYYANEIQVYVSHLAVPHKC